MTIDEAIELLEKYRHDHHPYPTDIMGKAEALGIEALKQLRANRRSAWPNKANILPGETE